MKTHLQSILRRWADSLFCHHRPPRLEHIFHLVPGQREQCKSRLFFVLVSEYASHKKHPMIIVEAIVDEFFDLHESQRTKMTFENFVKSFKNNKDFEIWSCIFNDENFRFDEKSVVHIDVLISKRWPDFELPIRKSNGLSVTIYQNLKFWNEKLKTDVDDIRDAYINWRNPNKNQEDLLKKMLGPVNYYKYDL